MSEAKGPSRQIGAAIVVGWALLAAYVEYGYASHGAPLELPLHDWVPGACWLVAGLIAWVRRPDVVIGRVMVAIGCAWFIGGLQSNPWLVGFNQLFSDTDLALIVWLVFAYPSGRISLRYERVYAMLVIAWILLVHLGNTLTFNPRDYYHCSCPSNALAVVESRRAYDTLQSIDSWVGAALAAGVFILLISRFARMTPAARRALYGLWSGSVLIAVFYVGNSLINSNSLSLQAVLVWDAVKDAAYFAIPVAFTAGLVRHRASRGRVGRLVDDLAAAPPVRLHTALVRALGDPSIEILYRVEGAEGFVDVNGHRRPIPDARGSRHVTPLVYRDHQLGVLVHDPALSEQPELIRSVCAAAGLALANERLQADVRAQLSEVRASRSRIVHAGDDERRRIERNLHDGAQQRLVATRLNLRLTASRAGAADPELGRELESAIGELEQAITELRVLARGIHPAVLTEQGLAAAVDVLVDRAAVRVRVDNQLAERLPPEIEAAAYYVIAEALTNVHKYAHATLVDVVLAANAEQLCVTVSDNGVGGADPTTGSGLRGLDDRVAAAGGRLLVSNGAQGGTCVRAEIPLSGCDAGGRDAGQTYG